MLANSDPAPVILHHDEVADGLLLTCEHAGKAVPGALQGLGLAQADLEDHIGWDPGAYALAVALSDRLGACLVAQAYSRLVIDCNRPRPAPDLVAPVSDVRVVPGNAGLTPAQIDARWNAIHQPFHAAVAARLTGRSGLISVHSFTPQLRNGPPRDLHIGILARDGNPLAAKLLAGLRASAGMGRVALNEPYTIDDDSDYTIPLHAEAHALPHLLLEVRNDLIADAAGVARIADALCHALTTEQP